MCQAASTQSHSEKRANTFALSIFSVFYRLESAQTGRDSESEMAHDSILLSQKLQTEVDQLKAQLSTSLESVKHGQESDEEVERLRERVKSLEDENADLKELAEITARSSSMSPDLKKSQSEEATSFASLYCVVDKGGSSDPDTVSHQSR